ncbi:MAG: hypothetical protein WCG25_03415 [bacterium]
MISSILISVKVQSFLGFHSFFNNKRDASKTSFKLCGAIFVAIPTAIHIVPLQR